MVQSTTRLYEGLFLVSQASAGSDFVGVVDHIKEVLARAEAEVLLLTKWDDRRLAYDIKNGKRGTYFLALFNARSTQIANIERDCNLSETIIRGMILRGDHIGEAELEEYMKSTPADQDPAMRGPEATEAPAVEAAPTTPEVATKEEAPAAQEAAVTEEVAAVETPATEEATAVTEEVAAVEAPATEEAAEKSE